MVVLKLILLIAIATTMQHVTVRMTVTMLKKVSMERNKIMRMKMTLPLKRNHATP